MKVRLSSLEFLLSVITFVLLLCCVGLALISWISLKPEGAVEHMQLEGHMVITEGAVFSDELRNSSSPDFKLLAFDVQMLLSEAFSLGELRLVYKSCEVRQFSKGTVTVTFELWFYQLVNVGKVEQELRAGLQEATGRGLVIDGDSIRITELPQLTTPAETSTTPTTPSTPTTAVTCRPYFSPCDDAVTCVPTTSFCDGVPDCPDASDEAHAHCATPCDGQFVLRGPAGSFGSLNPQTLDGRSCRWIFRVDRGHSVQVNVHQFETDGSSGFISFFEGVGVDKQPTGFDPPGVLWLLSDRSTVEFASDESFTTSAFNASFSTADTSDLSNQEKLACTFETGLCFWRQPQDDDNDWIRTRGASFPSSTGPSVDHTLGNSSGFYLLTPNSPGSWRKSYRIQSLPLSPTGQLMCLSFWFHMFGVDVFRLQVLLNVTVVFQKDGNYGDNWNYGQVMLNLSSETTVVFEALRDRGLYNQIALDDIALTAGPCGPPPPDPTTVAPPTTAPPIPAGCGGPFDLWETNSTFSSPNYPHSFGSKAKCLWTLHATVGQNIQLHFMDMDVDVGEDMVEVRDGAGPDSTLLAVLTGNAGVTHDLFSMTNRMTVWFFTDATGSSGRGFKANFTCGTDLGSPAPCAAGQFQCVTGLCIHGNDQCNGVLDCPDGADEADCVHLQVNGSDSLQLQVGSSLFTVCADTWTPRLSHLTCRYLGYRSGNASLLPAEPEDAPFVNVTVTSNGTVETSTSETCSSNKVIRLTCNNLPCGIRQVTNLMAESKQSADSTPAADDGRVVGGANAVKRAWPWMVSLHWWGNHVCGASLLSRDWLLTAAHCVYGKDFELRHWTAVLGLLAQSDKNSEEVQTRRVDQIIINRNYNRLTKEADIAMMHLHEPISFTPWVQPVCLPTETLEFPAGKKCFITGWGRDTENGHLPDVLQEAEVPAVNQTQCQNQLPEYTITPSMVCAGYPEGGIDACQGDSGGPLLCLDNGRWTVIGVTSFGVGCARPQRPGVYARVSAFNTWIAETRRSAYSVFSPSPPQIHADTIN